MQILDNDWCRLEAPKDDSVSVDGGRHLVLRGRWCLAELARIEAAWPESWLAASGEALPEGMKVTVDGSGLEHLDSAGALALLRRLAPPAQVTWTGFGAAPAHVLEQVRHTLAPPVPAGRKPAAAPPDDRNGAGRLRAALSQVGRGAAGMGSRLLGQLRFMGWVVSALAGALCRPKRLRLRELTVQIEQTGLNAIPVTVLVTSLIGVVLAYLLGLQAEKYGANIFVIDGVAIGVTREFAPIIVAVIVAGRSGAAFTAQLGAMRLAEETDAIRTLGLDVAQVLVVPRVLALVLTLPLLVFVGDVAALAGAMGVTGVMLGIGPGAFLSRVHESLDQLHVLVGLAKAPVFAFAVAVIGTRMGMTADRDTRAVGMATTSTVVQSIAAVILIDAGFAVLLQALGW